MEAAGDGSRVTAPSRTGVEHGMRRDSEGAGPDGSGFHRFVRAMDALRQGDFGHRLAVSGGEQEAQAAAFFNDLAQELGHLASEAQRMRRAVGCDGRLSERIAHGRGKGEWAATYAALDDLLDDLSRPATEIGIVLSAVADGDFTRPMDLRAEGVPLRGDFLRIGRLVNGVVDQLAVVTSEVTRVAREVGTEGRFGRSVSLTSSSGSLSGGFKDLAESVNLMADNLTSQVRDISTVVTAVAQGDLSKRITVSARGEVAALVETINSMTASLRTFAAEITRLAREIRTEGRFGGQADEVGLSGVWRNLTSLLNSTVMTLGLQVRDIAQVTTAVARGDLSKKITVEVAGEMLELKNTVNTMVDQLSGFSAEVTRVAREVGTEGQLGGQAQVPGAAGTWKDLTESVNSMANNLTGQVRNISQVATAVARGDLSRKIMVDARGEILELAETINTMVDQLSSFAAEVTRVAREVGSEGSLGGQADVKGVSGTWKDLTESVNVMANNLTTQVRNIAQVTTAVARGDLSQKITVDARGEILELKSTINTMVDQLSAFADEVTRVAREVGTEGQLGGQAQVPGVAGTWRDLTDSVNSMANNLTNQVRNISQVATAVAKGDLSQKITVDARGEILELKSTLNTMVDQLSAFADEVTRVAREVGTEGQLGGQAEVEGVSGTWKRLTDSVNQLAGNLTTQVRAIAEVATAVTEGDLTRLITVDASGEVAELKNNINQMIANLRETTQANDEQDWLKTSLARISGLMQGKRDLMEVAELIMTELTPVVSAQQGAFFLAEEAFHDSDPTMLDALRFIAGYGFRPDPGEVLRFRPGQSLVGQAASEGMPIVVEGVPADYIRVRSGLGEAPPSSVIVLPVPFEDRVLGVIELASFGAFSDLHRGFLTQLMGTIGVTVNTIIANSRTEKLLAGSQRLTEELQRRSEELQNQQAELRRSNGELEEKAALLASQNRDIEIKNSEIEQARKGLEERAEQLALSGKYKSEFLANMSHELRTPLNSLLILARLLADNPDRNLSSKQVEFAETIHSAGSDLLQLINDILDLSKVEAGKMEVNPTVIGVAELVDYVDATFRPLTAEKGLELVIEMDPSMPATLGTDEQRLQQVLRNLLSNAVKFTETGFVRLRAALARRVPPELGLPRDRPMAAFSVADTGIGIAADKLKVIFGAFQQADGTTSRKYGGTGLGLSISREIARLLDGEIHAASELGHGSVFTLYLPVQPAAAPDDGDRPDALAPTEGRAAAVHEARLGGERFTAVPPRADTAYLRTMPQLDRARRGEIAGEGEPDALQGAEATSSRRFDGYRVLVVDDDVRNVFALTSVLEHFGFTVLYAENGREGIEVLQRNEDVAIVLMDVMMPELDGYATTEAIRRMPQFSALPIIAVTAKAMMGDREKSIDSGANDYITKPVDTARLLDVLATWLN